MADDGQTVDVSSTGDLVGRAIGQYKVTAKIGQGGMATVYKAEQASIGRTVAIKVMPHHFLHDSSFMERFRREVQVIARLQHPRILPIHDYGSFEGMPYIVMAYMAGGTLAEIIEQGPMELEDIVPLLTQIAEALDHAHRNGVIHRDFKPSNVLLDENDNAYLADFGIAKISEATVELTGNAMVGTPAYMAPEMADRDDITPSVDVYALGVSLYQMLTGTLPYRGETPIRVLLAHTTDPIPDVRAARANLPPGVGDVVALALAKKPADRFQTAGALAQAMYDVVFGSPRTQPLRAGDVMNDTPTVREEFQAPAPDVAGGSPGDFYEPLTAAVPTPHGQPTPAKERTVLEPTPPPPSPAQSVSVPTPTGRKRGGGRVVLIGIAVVVGIVACLGLLAVLGVFNGGGSPGLPEGMGSITINNEASESLCYLFVSEDSESGWGPEQLGSERVIQSGESFTLSNIPVGIYDLRVETCDRKAVEHLDTEISGAFTWSIGE